MVDHSETGETQQSSQNEQLIGSEKKLYAQVQEGGNTQEQQTSLSLSLALFVKLSVGAWDVRNSLKILSNPLDLNKFMNDPKYKERVKKAIAHADKYGRILKKGAWTENLPKVKQALARVDFTHEQLINTKTGLSAQYEIELRNIYGLNDDQIKAVRERAIASLKGNPTGLTMQDALRNETKNEILHQTEEEVKNDNSIKRNQRGQEVKKRLDDKDQQFLQNPQTSQNFKNEQDLTAREIARGKQSVAQTLGIKLKPEETEILSHPLHEIITPSQPSITPSGPPPTPPISIPQPIPTPIPSVPSGGFRGLFNNVKSFFGDFRKSIGSLINLAKTAITTIGAALATGGLSAVLSLLKTLGLGLLKRIGKALLGDLGERISHFFESFFSPTNILKYAFFAVAAIVVVMLLPLIIASNNPASPPPGTSVQLQQ